MLNAEVSAPRPAGASRVPSTAMTFAVVGTVVAMFVLTWSDEAAFATTIPQLVSLSTLIDVSLTMAAMVAACLAWFAPRPAAWLTLAAVNPLVSQDLASVWARWWWAPLLLLIAIDIAPSSSRIVRPRSTTRTPAAGFSAPPSRERQLVAAVAVIAAVVTIALWSFHRVQLIALQERATATTGTVTEVDAEFDEVVVSIGGLEHDYVVPDASEVEVGDRVRGYTDPTGDFPPFIEGDPDPTFLTWTDSLVGAAASVAFFVGAIPWYRRRRTEQAAQVHGLPGTVRAAHGDRSMRIFTADDAGAVSDRGLLVRPFPVGRGTLTQPDDTWTERELDDEDDDSAAWMSATLTRLTGGLVLAETSDRGDADRLAADFRSSSGSDISPSPVDRPAVVHGEPVRGSMIVVEVDGVLWASAQPLRDPYTLRGLAGAVGRTLTTRAARAAAFTGRAVHVPSAARSLLAAVMIAISCAAGWFIVEQPPGSAFDALSHLAAGLGFAVAAGTLRAAVTPAVEVHDDRVQLSTTFYGLILPAGAVRAWRSGPGTVRLDLRDPDRWWVIGVDPMSSIGNERRLAQVADALARLDLRQPHTVASEPGLVKVPSPAFLVGVAAAVAYAAGSVATWLGLLPIV